MDQKQIKAVRFTRALRKLHMGARRHGTTDELPRGQFEVLLGIHMYIRNHGGPLRIGELSEHMERPMPAISRWLGDLEQRGLIRRFPGDDRRTVCVELTEEGRGIVDRGWEKLLASIEVMLRELGEEDADQLLELMERAGELFHKGDEEDA